MAINSYKMVNLAVIKLTIINFFLRKNTCHAIEKVKII